MSSHSTQHNIKSNSQFNGLLHGADLRSAMGFSSAEAFRLAVRNHRIPIPLIKLPGRKGWFARVSDICQWHSSVNQAFEAVEMNSLESFTD